MAAPIYFPISEISTYNPKWTIRARVTLKGNLRPFNRGGVSNQVFDCQLLDESAVEIRASFFGDAATENFQKLVVGKCYSFAKGSVRVANRQFNRCPHRYELSFDRGAEVLEVADTAAIDTVKYVFTDIHAISQKQMPSSADIVGVITAFKPCQSVNSKDGKALVKRDLTLADDTATAMTVTLWGERAQLPDKDFEGNPVVALKLVGLREWNGTKSGSLIEAGTMDLSPELPEAKRLRTWWAATGSSTNFANISLGGIGSSSTKREGLIDIKTLGEKELPVIADLVGIITAARPSFAFKSQQGKELVKREITVADASGFSLMVTLWGERAQQDDKVFEGNPTVQLKGVIVKEWQNTRSGSLLESGTMTFAPENETAASVRQWWSGGGASQLLTTLSQGKGGNAKLLSVEELRQAAAAVGSDPEVYQVVARLAFVQTRKMGEPAPLWYMACQEPREGTPLLCNKRLDSNGVCPSCNRQGKSAVRLNIRCRVADHSSSTWLTTFHEAAQGMLKATAEEIRALDLAQGGTSNDALEAELRRKLFAEPMQVTVRAKLDTYNGEVRTNVSCIDARTANFKVHGRKMLKNIHEMLGDTTTATEGGA